MSKINKDFGKMFGVASSKNEKVTDISKIENKNTELEIRKDNSQAEMIESDFSLARETCLEGIRNLQGHIETAKQFAEDAETARSIEVFYSLVKTSVDISGDLMDLHLKKLKLNENINNDKNESNNRPITNNLFVGSTKELQELLAQQNKDK